MSAVVKLPQGEEDNHDLMISDIDKMQQMAKKLMQTKHYQKLGEEGIFAIVQKAKSIGLNPLEALNGGMYFVQGKVEMQGQQMLSLIRAKGHSVTMDDKSNNSHVIMHGKRKDNGDTWTVEFGIEDAKRAGIYRGQWEKYPKIMCQWRCVSMLGRFLFSDILKGVYIQGEIRGEDCLDENEDVKRVYIEESKIDEVVSVISEKQAQELASILEECDPEVTQNILDMITKKFNISSLNQLPAEEYERHKKAALIQKAKYQIKLVEAEKANVQSEEYQS